MHRPRTALQPVSIAAGGLAGSLAGRYRGLDLHRTALSLDHSLDSLIDFLFPCPFKLGDTLLQEADFQALLENLSLFIVIPLRITSQRFIGPF